MAREGKTIGEAACTNCGHPCDVRVNKKQHLYIFCPPPADGGCGSGLQSRSDKGDGAIAARITKWRDAEAKKHYGALAPGTKTHRNAPKRTASSPNPKPEPPTPSPPPAKPWWDKELL